MRFTRTKQFKKDLNELEKRDKENIKEAFPDVKKALQGDVELFNYFRIKRMRGYPDIWEGHIKDNLCFTFHYDYDENGEKNCFFRRVGTHNIYINA
ncbi:MAG: hypothetical protein JW866_03100 [Ignavibacteriales bacterium]|nr:hypothetical protein [Ignavibacteriales bacterium]